MNTISIQHRAVTSSILYQRSLNIHIHKENLTSLDEQRYHYATTPSFLRCSISPSLIPNMSVNTSPVCCPSSGGGILILGSEEENLTGVLTNFIGPQAGWSTSLTMFRARTTQSVYNSATYHGENLTMFVVHRPLNIVDSSIGHAAPLQNF